MIMDLSHVEIRPARTDDVDGLWPLVERFATSYVPERKGFEAMFAAILADETSLLLVAVDPTRLAGFLSATLRPALYAGAPLAWVEELMVREDLRGLGIGRQLMEGVEAWARDRGAVHLALATRRADDFYTAIGYQESATYFKKPV